MLEFDENYEWADKIKKKLSRYRYPIPRSLEGLVSRKDQRMML